MSRTIDITGLPPEAVRAVEQFVAALRVQHGPGSGSPTTATEDRWRAAAEAAKGLTDYDFAASAEQRSFDRQHARDHLP